MSDMASKRGKTQYRKWKDFQLPEELMKALKENEYHNPLPIQARALRAALIQDKHIFGAARTGSGKTLAYLIPALTRTISESTYRSENLKRKISKSERKKEDFELIDGQMMSVEDMIVENSTDEDEVDDDDVEEGASNMGYSSQDSDDDESHSCPETIILVPTRELAMQVKEEVDKLCLHTEIKSCCLIGGMSQDKQLRNLKNLKPQVIIATPGRLFDIAERDIVQHLNLKSIASVKTLIVDEADRMVEKGHFEELLKIIDIIKDSKVHRQEQYPVRIYLFSATLTFLHELPRRLKKDILSSNESSNGKKRKNKTQSNIQEQTKKSKIKNLIQLLGIERSDTRIIDLNDDSTFGRPNSDQLSELKINCLLNEKDLYLYYFLVDNKGKRTLIFCNSKDCVRRLANVLKYLGIESLTIHSEMDQKKRLSSLEKFRAHEGCVLVATDIAARGLDIKDLDCVAHYQVPRTCESYIHRSGRTARLFKKGISLTLCEPKEAPLYRRLCNNINGGKDLESYPIDTRLRSLLKDRVHLAQQCDKIDHNLRESNSNKNWFTKAAEKCDIELDEDEIRKLCGKGKSSQRYKEDEAHLKKKLAQLKKQLNMMLKRPLVTRELLMKNAKLPD